MDLTECKRKGFVKIAFPNTSKALSLLEIADIKEETVLAANLNSKNINAYLPLAYDALRETLEALCILLGYTITNHICLGELLKEKIPGFDYIGFDRFRYIRNGINYYGNKIELSEGKILLKKIFELKKSVTKEIHLRIKT